MQCDSIITTRYEGSETSSTPEYVGIIKDRTVRGSLGSIFKEYSKRNPIQCLMAMAPKPTPEQCQAELSSVELQKVCHYHTPGKRVVRDKHSVNWMYIILSGLCVASILFWIMNK